MPAGGTLYLMRHGEPAHPGRLLGHRDDAATDAGIAACVAQAQGLAIDRLVSSDLRRARACAEAIGTPEIDPRWRELDFGAWDGLAASEIDPQALGRFWDDADAWPPPGGERWSALVARVGAAIDALPAGDALVVTHGGPMRAALHRMCGFTLMQCWAFDLPCAAVLALRWWPGPQRQAQVVGLWA